MFRITIHELDPQNGHEATERYAQTVDRIDLTAIIKAVNTPVPEPPKPKKRRSDAGKPRVVKPEPLGM